MNDTTTNQSSIGHLIEPEPISYSFNTPGWHLVLLLLLVVALVVVIVQYRKYRKNAYRREAIKYIESLVQQKNKHLVFEINSLLKIMAINLFGRKKVASLYGKEWYEFVVSTMDKKETISKNKFEKFTNALYNSNNTLNKNELVEFVEFAVLWIKNHRVNV